MGAPWGVIAVFILAGMGWGCCVSWVVGGGGCGCLLGGKSAPMRHLWFRLLLVRKWLGLLLRASPGGAALLLCRAVHPVKAELVAPIVHYGADDSVGVGRVGVKFLAQWATGAVWIAALEATPAFALAMKVYLPLFRRLHSGQDGAKFGIGHIRFPVVAGSA